MSTPNGEEQEEFASTRFWKTPNTLDAEVPPALVEDPEKNIRRIHDIAEASGKPDDGGPDDGP